MKLNLRIKIVLAFSIMILAGMLLMVFIVNITTRNRYQNFTKQNDIEYNKKLARTLEEFYASKHSWDGVEGFLQLPKSQMGRMPGNRPNNRMFPQVILTDANGNLIIEFLMNKTPLRNPPIDYLKGEPILYNNNIVGYLLTGTMINSGLTPKEESFLLQIKQNIIIVSIFILLGSIIFSNFFSWKITTPIRALSKSVTKIKEGNYNTKVEVKGTDEISNLGVAFNSMVTSLKKSDIWRKQIIADSAHELRTPVTLLQGNLELILEGVYKADKEHIQNLYNETLMLSRLIKELQELSSAESGSMKLNRQEVELGELIKNTLEIFKPESIKKNIEIIYTPNTNKCKLYIDSQKFKQVLTNVLSNALRHTPNNGTIKVCIQNIKNSTQIKISDTGCGINKNDIDKIFERFYRTDNARNRKHGGSGLGLAISREIVRLHNGTISAESELNSGTTITINLPLN